MDALEAIGRRVAERAGAGLRQGRLLGAVLEGQRERARAQGVLSDDEAAEEAEEGAHEEGRRIVRRRMAFRR